MAFARDARVALDDFEPIRRASGYDVRGVLGMDFLRRYVIDFSPDHGRLRFLDAPTEPDQPSIPIEFFSGVPFAIARIDGVHRMRLLLDTGFYSGASAGLSREAFGKLLAFANKATDAAPTILTTTTSERIVGRTARVQSLSVGDATAFDVNLDEVGSDVLGLTFFSRFRVVFDFPNGVFYLTPGKRSKFADQRDRSGLHIWRVGSKVLVHTVDGGSPAEKASIEARDEIVRINGHNASARSLHSIRVLLRADDIAIPVDLRRGDKQFTVHLFVKDNKGENKGN